MAFSSQLFLYGFMPVFFALYYLLPDRYKNGLILIGSLLFYSVGAGSAVLVLVASIFLNQFIALRISEAPEPRRRILVVIGIAINILSLAYYKYTGFLWHVVDDAMVSIGLHSLPPAPSIPLPIGISFFTFQAISYLVDVYVDTASPAPGYFEFATYHSLFAKLTAGPIVRYREIGSQMQRRRVDELAVTEGAYRFCLGLGKKLVVADSLGNVVDATFALPTAELDAVRAWTGLVCYTLQIYYDFSGYSDMAIGLGRMLGFEFPENFNQPYRARSITDFWQRWHMTLTRFIISYLYNPIVLRAVRKRAARGLPVSPGALARPLPFLAVIAGPTLLTMSLLGLWHGAAFGFIAFGFYHGVLLVIERLYMTRFGPLPRGPIMWASTLLLVMIGWVIFRAPTLDAAWHYFAAMFLLGPAAANGPPVMSYLTPEILCYAAIGVFFAFAPLDRLSRLRFDRTAVMAAQLGLSSASLFYSLLLLAANGFNPFIYFRF